MNSRFVRSVSLVMLAASFLLLGNRAAAQDEEDPPSRVARLGYINGQVSFNPAGTDDWVSAVVNRPITTGDKLWTDDGGRAELHIGSAAIRLSQKTGFSFLNLSDRMMQIRLTEGTVGIRVRRLGEDEAIEVDTPNLAFSILRPGRYRVNVNEAGDTTIINVTDGQGEVTGGGSSYTVRPGQQGIFTGTDSLDGDIEGLPDADSFDQWSDQRDLREDHAVARRYVSDDVIGYEDLDDYGGWRPTSEYGTVWFPHVTAVGWAPYRYGHWAYIAPWGWTWVDDSPWGFAPFHYGRWISVGGAWGWVPCPPRVVAVAYVRPVYAPALVAWVGGPHFAVGIGVGGGFAAGVNVGWFPLGPREVFVPSYPVSRTYVNNVNVSNTNVNTTVVNNYYNTTVVNKNVAVSNVNNVHYMNQNVNGAVTATSPHAFTSAQPVGRNMVAVNQREIASAPVTAAAPAVVPPKQAFLGSGAATNVRPPVALQTRAVVAKATPPPAPLPVQQRQAAIQANQGRPIAIAQARQLQTVHANATTAVAVAPVKIAPAASPAAPKTNAMQNNGAANNTRTVNPNPNRPPVNNGYQQNSGTQPTKGLSPQAAANRPPSARPTSVSNPQLEQKHQQQNEQLQQKQDQERQKVEQQQYQQQQKLQQQNANEQKQKQVQQQQEQKLQQLEQKHEQQAQVLKQKQESEHAHSAPAKQSKPTKEEEKPKH